MTITHTEGYFLTWDVGPEVIEMIKQRMLQKYGDVKISDDTQGIHFYAKDSIHANNEEGNDEGQALQRIVRANADDKRDQGSDGADGLHGVVLSTGSDQV